MLQTRNLFARLIRHKSVVSTISTRPWSEQRPTPIPYQHNYNIFLGPQKQPPHTWKSSNLEMKSPDGLPIMANFLLDAIRTNNLDAFYDKFKSFYFSHVNDSLKKEEWYTKETLPFVIYITLFGLFKLKKFPDLLNFWDQFKPLLIKNSDPIPQPVYRILFHAFYYIKDFIEFDKYFTEYQQNRYPITAEVTNCFVRRSLFAGETLRIRYILKLPGTQRDVFTDLFMLRGYIKYNRKDDLLATYKHLITTYQKDENFDPVNYAWVNMLKWGFESERIDVILLVMQDIHDIGRSNVDNFVVLFCGFGRIKDRENFDRSYELFKALKLPYRETILASLFSAYLSFHDAIAVQNLQIFMKHENISPTAKVWDILFHGFYQLADYKSSLQIYQEIYDYGFDKNHQYSQTLENLFLQFSSTGLIPQMMSLYEILIKTNQFSRELMTHFLKTMFKSGYGREVTELIDLAICHEFPFVTDHCLQLLRYYIKVEDPINFKKTVAIMEARKIPMKSGYVKELVASGYTQLNLLEEMFDILSETSETNEAK